LSPVWYWAALPVVAALVVQALRGASRRQLSDNTRLNVFLGTAVALLLLWSIRAGIRPGLGFHLLGATACTLMFGPRLALLAMTLVMTGAAAAGNLQWWSLPLNVMLMGAVPVAVSWGILRAVERWLPAHLFVTRSRGLLRCRPPARHRAGGQPAAGCSRGLLDYLGAEYAPWFRPWYGQSVHHRRSDHPCGLSAHRWPCS
jgi:hypothetical protein